MDDNVHPSLTMQLADALIAANKDFDMLIIPFTNHAFFDLRWGLEAADRFVSSVTPTSSASVGTTSSPTSSARHRHRATRSRR